MLTIVIDRTYLKSNDTPMSEWGASDDSPVGTVWSEYVDGWETRRVERWNDRWLFIRDRRCLDQTHWSDEGIAELLTAPDVDPCASAEFDAVWAEAWNSGLEDVGTQLLGDRAELLRIDPQHSPHRENR